jgi:hypothetical protein
MKRQHGVGFVQRGGCVLGKFFFEGDDVEEVELWGDRDDHLLTRQVTAKIKRHKEK